VFLIRIAFDQVTRRYAEFSAAVASMTDSQPNEIVSRLLAQLSDEVECLLLRMAAVFPQRKEQLVFLINNLDLVLTVHAVIFFITCTL
jgi:vacuolar protein sorting-associated protein 52